MSVEFLRMIRMERDVALRRAEMFERDARDHREYVRLLDSGAFEEDTPRDPPKLHEEQVADGRSHLQRFLERFRHRHYVVRRTWTMDETSWAADTNAREYCSCGAHRHLWHGGYWWPA